MLDRRRGSARMRRRPTDPAPMGRRRPPRPADGGPSGTRTTVLASALPDDRQCTRSAALARDGRRGPSLTGSSIDAPMVRTASTWRPVRRKQVDEPTGEGAGDLPPSRRRQGTLAEGRGLSGTRARSPPRSAPSARGGWTGAARPRRRPGASAPSGGAIRNAKRDRIVRAARGRH